LGCDGSRCGKRNNAGIDVSTLAKRVPD
jgi:hypothetical protein